jgi:hypothetical protein
MLKHDNRSVPRARGAAAPLALLICLVVLASACTPASRWRARAVPRSLEVPVLLESSDPSHMMRDFFPEEIPNVPIRKRLRPCCAFGSELGAKLGPIPVPFFRISNVLDVSEIGPHTYDSGLLLVRYGEAREVQLNQERNGLVYTCRGGFIDLAHVRDYTDWASFLVARLGATLETGTTVELGEEGGERRVVTSSIPPEVIERLGRRRVAMVLAAWLAFEMSVYHEIVTWFGWAAVPGFSERASAFSPEDTYSNLIGVKLASALTYLRLNITEGQYSVNVDVWLRKLLKYLGPVDASVGQDALEALDGVWWDSKRRLPDPQLVQRRQFDYGSELAPWLVPDALSPSSLREACAETEPVILSNPHTLESYPLSEVARLEIDVPKEWAEDEPWKRLGPRITQADFPAIIAFVREAALEEFGPRADQPD